MAAAFLQHLAGAAVEVLSAGSLPAGEVNPVAVEAMREAGLDLSRERPRLLQDSAVRRADVVITMGCGDVCPVYPGKRYEDWDLPDPAGRSIAEVRSIRDEIERRVRDLMREMGLGAARGRGELYDAAYDRRAAAGENVHGEADFVMRYSPRSVLDAGCGTGRVGRELARRGVEVVGVDLDAEMLATARIRSPAPRWLLGDVSTIELGRTFSLILMAGNVINFVVPGRRRAAVLNLARHLEPGGLLVCGHSVTPDGCPPEDLGSWAGEAGLELLEHWSTWDRDPHDRSSEYSLTVHRAGMAAPGR